MKNLLCILIAIIGSHVATAVGLSAPIDGYSVVNITWALQPNISGIEPVNITGTVQDAWKHINQTWPGYTLPKFNGTGHGPLPTSRQPPANLSIPATTMTTTITPTGIHQNDPARETGTVKCWIWPEANEYWIAEGIDYLNEVPGKPSNAPGPGECGRVSCSWSAAIWWCNDNDYQYTLDSFWEIAQGAQDIDSNCHYVDPWSLRIYTSGQNFFTENWNVIVKYDDDDC
ncbi:hypothetical protein VMCG_08367 [Cytospora schulzeri]|uniref:SCP domain-containing protein n=1 Tax=Cytospora schulzeri TaxID=448051 RepID=A0A423VV67_9PEZI|nr:hypothetical protein VMCG_08367 [Valsa malicola]